MAIPDFLPGVSITVCVDNVPLTEYPDPDPCLDLIFAVDAYKACKTISRYIEAVSDTEFTINFTVQPPYVQNCANLCFSVCVDGALADELLCSRPVYERQGMWKDAVCGDERTTIEGTYLRRFRFAAIKTTDEANSEKVKKEERRLKKCGEIMIEVHRKSYGRPARLEIEEELERQVETEVPEAALKGKAISHSTIYGPAVRTATPRHWIADFCDGVDYPIAIFKFKYRSRETLRQLQIIPRKLSPESEPETKHVPSQEFSATPFLPSLVLSQPSLSSPASPWSTIIEEFNKLTAEQQAQLRLLMQSVGVATPFSSVTTSLEVSGKAIKRERDVDPDASTPSLAGSTTQPDKKMPRTRLYDRKYKEIITVDLTGDDGESPILIE